jgi:hypothetical protein
MLRVRRTVGIACFVFGGPFSLVSASCTELTKVLPEPAISDAGSEDVEPLDSSVEPPPDGAASAEDGAAPDSAAEAGFSEAGVSDAGGRDAAVDASYGACGICDREWVCNNLKQLWKTESDGRCVNQANRTGLRCNGILDGPSARDVGLWTGDSTELQLKFRDLNGAFRIYYCYATN